MSRSVALEFELGLYEAEDIQKASYRMLRYATVDIKSSGGRLTCVVTANHDLPDADLESVIEEFKKELLDQRLRSKIFKETAAVRNLILGVAFSKTGLQSSE